MLLTGFPSALVRSPDRTTWRFLRATNQNRKPSQMGGELVVACETGTLLIRSTRKIIQCPPRRFCRVPYIGFTAGTRKRIATHETWPTLKRFRHFKESPEMGRANEQKSSAYVGCPTDL